MTTKHPALRLAEMTDVTDRSVIWQKWKQDACEQLRTQYALLERVREELAFISGASMLQTASTPQGFCYALSPNDMRRANEALTALNQHLEPKA